MPGGFSKRTSSAVCACAALPWQAPPAAPAMVAAAAMKPRRDAFGSSPSGATDVCSLAMGVLLGDAGSGYYGADARVPDGQSGHRPAIAHQSRFMTHALVSRFRSSHHYAAASFANFGIEGH